MPKPGTYYTVVAGDDFMNISQRAYGKNKAWDIIRANSDLLTGRDKDAWGAPIIYPKDRLWIPKLADSPETGKQPETISAENDSEVAIRINGRVFKGWETNSINRSLETCADSFTFVATFRHDTEQAKFFKPHEFQKCDLLVGGELYIAGEIMKITPDAEEGETSITCEVRTFPGVTVDCQSQDPSLNDNNQTLKQIADNKLKPFGIQTYFPDGDTDAFPKVNREITETIFGFLVGLASQKGFVITSTYDSKMAFVRANVNGKPIAALKQGEQPLIHVSTSYDATKRYSHYIALSQSAGQPGIKAIVQDKTVKAYRPLIFTADDTEAGNIKDAALWKRARALAASMPVEAIVRGWRTPARELWKENEIVTLYYPNCFITRETRFLISNVAPTRDNNGDIVTLSLVLPQAYTLDFPEVMPWN